MIDRQNQAMPQVSLSVEHGPCYFVCIIYMSMSLWVTTRRKLNRSRDWRGGSDSLRKRGTRIQYKCPFPGDPQRITTHTYPNSRSNHIHFSIHEGISLYSISTCNVEIYKRKKLLLKFLMGLNTSSR